MQERVSEFTVREIDGKEKFAPLARRKPGHPGRFFWVQRSTCADRAGGKFFWEPGSTNC